MGFGLGSIGGVLGAVNPVAAVATAGLGFGDSLLQGYQNRKAAQKANKYAYTAWQLQNEYNTPLEQRKRLEEAGYNPNLWYTSGNTGNAGTLATSGYSPGDWNISQKAMKGLSQYQEIQAQQASIANTQANTEQTKAQVDMMPIIRQETLSRINEINQRANAVKLNNIATALKFPAQIARNKLYKSKFGEFLPWIDYGLETLGKGLGIAQQGYDLYNTINQPDYNTQMMQKYYWQNYYDHGHGPFKPGARRK